ncbi:MAG: AAA family ATPase [Lachnospiraceae bacterium]|nr:AAA family ATPase [Lachnospiraceae bacterium]
MGLLDLIHGLVIGNDPSISDAFLQDNIPAANQQASGSKPQPTPVQPVTPTPPKEPAPTPVTPKPVVQPEPMSAPQATPVPQPAPAPAEPPLIIPPLPGTNSGPNTMFSFDFPELLARAKNGDSGFAIMVARDYSDRCPEEHCSDDAVYWMYEAFRNSNAPTINFINSAITLGRWYTLGFHVPVDYNRALDFFEQAASRGSETVLPYIKELREVVALQNNPELIYLDLVQLFEKLELAEQEEKEIVTLFYSREIMKKDPGLGFSLYGEYIFSWKPLDFEDRNNDFARACFLRAKKLGYTDVALSIAKSYEDDSVYAGNLPQLRRWAELAIEQNEEGAQEFFDEMKEAVEDSYIFIDEWESDEPLIEQEYPDWFLAGIFQTELPKTVTTGDSRTSNTPISEEHTDPRELPENIDGYFEGFIGMTHVKEQLQKIYNAVKLQQRRDEILRQRGEEPAPNDKGFNFILLGNPGTGKTSVARIIAKILYDLNIREKDILLEVERSKLVGEHIGSTENRMRAVLDSVQGGTLFIDEAYTLYKEDSDNDFGQEAIDVLMKDMEDHRNSYSVIMAGYKQPMLTMIKNANSGFSSRFTYQIEIPDYTEEELIEIAHIHIDKLKYQMDDGVDDAIRKCIRHDKIDDTFGNARYARELVNRAVENQATRLNALEHATDDDLFLLTAADFWEGTMEEETVESLLKELDSMVGLASVKEEVKTLINRITVMTEMEKRGLALSGDFGTLHMAFKGNPGTGKTTVARLLGKLYAALGILKRNDVFVECNRAGLVGKYQGHTAANVEKVVQSALSGILFIDEAYSLVQGEGDSFGKEAVDTLVAEIENHRKNLVVIFAGYSDDMDRFFENNQGLKSRVPLSLTFEDYNEEELFAIAAGMIESRHLKLAEDAALPLTQLIRTKSHEQDFGNARGIRNLVDGFIRQQNVRIAKALGTDASSVTDEALITLMKEDIY